MTAPSDKILDALLNEVESFRGKLRNLDAALKLLKPCAESDALQDKIESLRDGPLDSVSLEGECVMVLLQAVRSFDKSRR